MNEIKKALDELVAIARVAGHGRDKSTSHVEALLAEKQAELERMIEKGGSKG